MSPVSTAANPSPERRRAPVPRGALLLAIASELTRAAQDLDHLQDLLSQSGISHGRAAPLPPGAATALQDIDRLRQTLAALGRLQAHLYQTVGAEDATVPPTVLRSILGLDSVSDRLMAVGDPGASTDPPGKTSHDAAGVPRFF